MDSDQRNIQQRKTGFFETEKKGDQKERLPVTKDQTRLWTKLGGKKGGLWKGELTLSESAFSLLPEGVR